MKWSVFGLIGVGVLAAVCAAALVVSLRAWRPGPGNPGDNEVSVVIATENLQRMTLVRSEQVATKRIPRAEADSTDPSDPAQVVGRPLARDMVKGQLFRQNNLVAEGTGLRIASFLRPGMRAVCLPLPDADALVGNLYAGAVVDVMAAFKTRSGTLLRRVQVLAIGDQSVISDQKAKDDKSGKSKSGKKGQTLVTLLLTSKQAEKLHLAKRLGSISLSLRGPTDRTPVEYEGVNAEDLLAGRDDDVGVSIAARSTGNGDRTTVRPRSTKGPKGSPSSKRLQHWTIDIIRGSNHEEASFPMPDRPEETVPKS